MGARRMFSKNIVSSDVFLSMHLSAQALYFMFGMNCDDEGVVPNPKALMKIGPYKQKDFDELIKNRYILVDAKSGVVIIKHHFINNTIQKDRFKQSTYREELEKLTQNEFGAYTEKDRKINKKSKKVCIQETGSLGSTLDPQYKLSKVKLNKKKVSKKEDTKSDDKTFNDIIDNFITDVSLNKALKEWVKARLLRKEKITNYAVELACKKVLKMPIDKQIKSVEESIIRGWKGIFEVPDENLKDKAREAYIKDIESKSKPKTIDRKEYDKLLMESMSKVDNLFNKKANCEGNNTS